MLTDPAGKATSTEYRLDEGATQTATLASGKTTLTLTPTTRGTHTLTARVKSAADTWSDWAEYTFRTGNITGTLAVPFINKIAETHFADLLHPADGLEATDEPDEEIADEATVRPATSSRRTRRRRRPRTPRSRRPRRSCRRPPSVP